MISFDRNIYLLYKNTMLLIKIIFKEGCFIPIEKYKIYQGKENFLCN